MKIEMWWGMSYIMRLEADSMTEFIEKVMRHVENFWSNLNREDFAEAWRQLNEDGHGCSGRFEFYKGD